MFLSPATLEIQALALVALVFRFFFIVLLLNRPATRASHHASPGGLTERRSQPRHPYRHVSVAIGEAESKSLNQVVELVALRDRRPNVDAGRHYSQALA